MLANRVRMGSGSEKLDPSTWKGIQNIVRKGIANEFFTVGDQLMSNYDSGQITWEIIGIDVETPSDTRFTHSMTLQTKNCLPNRVFDPSNNNRYINSSIREHLNNEFLTKLETELSAVLGKVDKKVARWDGGQDDFSDKVFLLSLKEVGLGTSGTTTGESVYPFYDGVADAKRNKESKAWWLRSPYMGYPNTPDIVYIVGASGRGSFYYAKDPTAVAPACVII